ncbi:MAG TPA: hypothetical protein VEU96_33410 [Bryobacteraceae bacterium]|nr:hypothetical protein [Bryobacteraceae bacterium]
MAPALRSVLAVLGGYATMAFVVILFTGIVKMLAPAWMAMEGKPAASYLAVNLTYSFVAALLGGYVAAWIAARLPVQHALALGVLVLLGSIASAMQTGDRQPRWYQAALAILMPLAVVLGGYGTKYFVP